jgi:hypothetical protein
MHSLLAATVLVSGLAVGDGGSSGAPAATTCVDFSGAWEGTWESCGVIRARLILTGEKIYIIRDGGCGVGGPPSYPCSLIAEDATTVRITFAGRVFRGLYQIKGREVRIYPDNGGLVWALRRYEPKK